MLCGSTERSKTRIPCSIWSSLLDILRLTTLWCWASLLKETSGSFFRPRPCVTVFKALELHRMLFCFCLFFRKWLWWRSKCSCHGVDTYSEPSVSLWIQIHAVSESIKRLNKTNICTHGHFSTSDTTCQLLKGNCLEKTNRVLVDLFQNVYTRLW